MPNTIHLKNGQDTFLDLNKTPEITIKGRCIKKVRLGLDEKLPEMDFKDIVQYGSVMPFSTPEGYGRARRVSSFTYPNEKYGMPGAGKERRLLAVRRLKGGLTAEEKAEWLRWIRSSVGRNYYQDSTRWDKEIPAASPIMNQYTSDPDHGGAYYSSCAVLGCCALGEIGKFDGLYRVWDPEKKQFARLFHFLSVATVSHIMNNSAEQDDFNIWEDVPGIHVCNDTVDHPELLEIGDGFIYSGLSNDTLHNVGHVEWVTERYRPAKGEEDGVIMTPQGPLHIFENLFDKTRLDHGTTTYYIPVKENDRVVMTVLRDYYSGENDWMGWSYYVQDKASGEYVPAGEFRSRRLAWNNENEFMRNIVYSDFVPAGKGITHIKVTVPEEIADCTMVSLNSVPCFHYVEYGAPKVVCWYYGCNMLFCTYGKNLYAYQDDKYTIHKEKENSLNGAMSSMPAYSIARSLSLKPNTEYTFSFAAGPEGLKAEPDFRKFLCINIYSTKDRFVQNLMEYVFDGSNDMAPGERRSITFKTGNDGDYAHISFPNDLDPAAFQVEYGSKATDFEEYVPSRRFFVQSEFLLADANGVCDEYDPINGIVAHRCETFVYDGISPLKDGFICNTAVPKQGSIIVQAADEPWIEDISIRQNTTELNPKANNKFDFLPGYNRLAFWSEIDTDVEMKY